MPSIITIVVISLIANRGFGFQNLYTKTRGLGRWIFGGRDFGKGGREADVLALIRQNFCSCLMAACLCVTQHSWMSRLFVITSSPSSYSITTMSNLCNMDRQVRRALKCFYKIYSTSYRAKGPATTAGRKRLDVIHHMNTSRRLTSGQRVCVYFHLFIPYEVYDGAEVCSFGIQHPLT